MKITTDTILTYLEGISLFLSLNCDISTDFKRNRCDNSF